MGYVYWDWMVPGLCDHRIVNGIAVARTVSGGKSLVGGYCDPDENEHIRTLFLDGGNNASLFPYRNDPHECEFKRMLKLRKIPVEEQETAKRTAEEADYENPHIL